MHAPGLFFVLQHGQNKCFKGKRKKPTALTFHVVKSTFPVIFHIGEWTNNHFFAVHLKKIYVCRNPCDLYWEFNFDSAHFDLITGFEGTSLWCLEQQTKKLNCFQIIYVASCLSVSQSVIRVQTTLFLQLLRWLMRQPDRISRDATSLPDSSSQRASVRRLRRHGPSDV